MNPSIPSTKTPGKIRCGILGYGYMGTIRHKHLVEDPRYELRTVSHTAPVTLTDGIELRTSWESVVDDPQLDAVFVCLPNYMAKDAIVRAFERGKHVFAEKPPGITVDETEAMLKAAKAAGTVLKFGFNHRYHPAIIRAQRTGGQRTLWAAPVDAGTLRQKCGRQFWRQLAVQKETGRRRNPHGSGHPSPRPAAVFLSRLL